MLTLVRGRWLEFPGGDIFDLDLLTILIAYLFLHYGHTATGAYAFVQGFLIDLFSGGLYGLFTFLYLGVFWSINLGCRFFNLLTFRGQMMIVALAVLLKKILFLAVPMIFSMEIPFSRHYFWTSMTCIFFTALAAPVIFRLFNFLRAVAVSDTSQGLNE